MNAFRFLMICVVLSISPGMTFADDLGTPKNPSLASESPEQLEEIATFAGGCFWCSEAVFERVKGVKDVVSGYIGGHVPSPTYAQVKSKRTGHAEAVEIYFDPKVVSYEELLKIFFKTHDPTTLNQQGIDKGPQYRSVVFFHDEQQQETVESVIQKMDADHEYRRPIVTEVLPATLFYVAEEYHQDYFRRNPRESYCRRVVIKKVRKFKNLFPEQVQPASAD